MNSRSNILKAIAAANYTEVQKPTMTSIPTIDKDVVATFLLACQRNGSAVITAKTHGEAMEHFQEQKTGFQSSEIRKNEEVEILLSNSRLGVAENGAVWLDETDITQRIAPFASNHLCVIVHSRDIVATMHDAYTRLYSSYTPLAFPGFGVFIAGPSKTADIEQTLVIGAQGAKQHTIILIAE